MTMSSCRTRFLVVGATSGLGWHLAQSFVFRGASVLAAGRRADRLRALHSRLHAAKAQGTIFIKPADVMRPATLAALVSAALETWGGLDCVVYASAIYSPSSFEPSSLARWRESFDTNFWGFHYLVTEMATRVPNRPMHLIAFTSSLALHGESESTAYGLSKCLLEAYVTRVDMVLAQERIHLHILDPGPFRSEMNPLCEVPACAASNAMADAIWALISACPVEPPSRSARVRR